MIQYLRLYGGGHLYALSPTFTGKATFYNKTLLDQLSMSYPTDGMNWSELLDFAANVERARKGRSMDAVSFFYNRDMVELVTKIAESRHIQYIDEARNVTFETNGWRDIISNVLEKARAGTIMTKEMDGDRSVVENAAFTEGNVVLTVDYSYLLDRLQQSEFDWGVVRCHDADG
ncbi:hypothetical protein ACFSTH_11100 [Paenibacillus yanchengensis]|uniref:Uncharacterized protein n=1 Tax=Paenibacillus yanchengensis TaxID=2035833 RepID=A0ABW4YK25_9BACL